VFAPALDAFASRALLYAPSIAALRELSLAGELATSWRSLCASLVHMHVNRMLRTNPRAHELVLYSLLQRAYRSQLARRASTNAD